MNEQLILIMYSVWNSALSDFNILLFLFLKNVEDLPQNQKKHQFPFKKFNSDTDDSKLPLTRTPQVTDWRKTQHFKAKKAKSKQKKKS